MVRLVDSTARNSGSPSGRRRNPRLSRCVRPTSSSSRFASSESYWKKAVLWGRRVIGRNSGVIELRDFDYLLHGPDDRAGALGFGPAVEPPAARRRFNRTLDLAALQRAADAVLDDDREGAGSAADRVEELLLLGTSMGGGAPQGGGGARGRSLDRQVRAPRRPPAYDLTPSPVVARERRDLAMACGRFGRHANRTNLLSGHGRFLLDRTAAAEVFDGIASTVRGRWHAEMRRAGVSARDGEAIRSAFLYDGLFYENVAPAG